MTKLTGDALLGSFAPVACDWTIISKAKRGPLVRWTCKACHAFGKTMACPFAAGRALLAGDQP